MRRKGCVLEHGEFLDQLDAVAGDETEARMPMKTPVQTTQTGR